MCNPQHEQVLGSNGFEERARYLPLYGKMPDGSFCHVIIPGDTVVFNKRKEALSIPLKTALISYGQVGMVNSVRNNVFEEVLYLLTEFMEVSFL